MAPAPPQDAGGLARTTMTQPGVYFTLDAPFVSIIGLYTNVLEGPGVITDENGAYPVLKGDGQFDWLVAELKRLAPQRAAGERAVLLACHHPPASADKTHGGTTGLANDLDRAFTAAGLWPNAILSGHAHIYQRFARSVNGKELPYVVAGGSPGHDCSRPQPASDSARRLERLGRLHAGRRSRRRVRLSDDHRRHARPECAHPDDRVHGSGTTVGVGPDRRHSRLWQSRSRSMP